MFGADRQSPSITNESFGTTSTGRSVEIFTLTNASGIKARIMNYGGTLVSLIVPGRASVSRDVVLGFGSLREYETHRIFLGALIGRYANRIAKARFSLNGTEYCLAANNGENHLHGGIDGYDRVIWTARPYLIEKAAVLELSYLSPDGEEGYPGDLQVAVVYSLNDENELSIRYTARSDADTIINLTNHSYFNLEGGGDILGHRLSINADRFTPVDNDLIPTGELRSVTGTPFDFRTPELIGSRIGQPNEQLRFANGYDHNWVLSKEGGELSFAGDVYDPVSGRAMEVLTTQPGIQFYSGNFLDGGVTGKDGTRLAYRSGFCLETQHFPDSPNQPGFPTVLLRAGDLYEQTTIYRFSTRPK